MSRIIAALDNKPVARPVALAAPAIARLFDARPELVHVREDGTDVARAAAEVAGLELRVVAGSPTEQLVALAEDPATRAMVVGTRAAPGGREPAGSTALELITTVSKPIVAVPPHAVHPERLRSVLVPLEGTPVSSAAVEEVILLARGLDVEVIVLHVLVAESVPSFSEQPYHEERAWAEEFVARHCPCPIEEVNLEVRVGAPGGHVLSASDEMRPDLLALGWSQTLAAGRAAVVREVLTSSAVPVLLVPVPA